MNVQEVTQETVVRVVRMLEVRGSRREIAAALSLSTSTVQAAIDQAAVWWLGRWRSDRAIGADDWADP